MLFRGIANHRPYEFGFEIELYIEVGNDKAIINVRETTVNDALRHLEKCMAQPTFEGEGKIRFNKLSKFYISE